MKNPSPLKSESAFSRLYSPATLYEPVDYTMNQGGKKIRFNITLLACKAFTDDVAKAELAAKAIEMFHNFTLVHDDVIDRADTRRGQPAVHKKWDLNTALLSGDVMLILAYEYLTQIQHPNLSQILQKFTKTAREVCEGQQMDIDFENLPAVQMDSYIDMISKKTAVLVGAAMYIGSKCGGAEEADALSLYQFGLHLGIAFQIRDDILDCYGDKVKVGKTKGGDILQGKKTILYIRTWNTLSPEDQVKFEKLYYGSDSDKINQVLEWFIKSDAKSYALEMEKNYFRKAINHLKQANIPEHKMHDLFDFANELMDRDH
ncbi:polyprenyl synthetase family protein [Membranihabitans marinus]|uniref:polyprenyl synthetase family protein n=1 Tax=Membranihabitans marinus TaxID=1227546 RepID=UPI001F2E9A62|nr:polyprenyl synthetase family protein [Membranihabitans marinus]